MAEAADLKKINDKLANDEASRLLGSYVRKYKWLLSLGVFLNVLGMVGEFISPLFIGWVIDAIVDKD